MSIPHKPSVIRMHSSSPEARNVIDPHKNSKNSESISNNLIRLIIKDEDIFSKSCNLTFQLTTLVPTNSPIATKRNETFQFTVSEEIESNSPNKPESMKNYLLAKIQSMKLTAKPPNYLKSLISRPYIIESVSTQPSPQLPAQRPIKPCSAGLKPTQPQGPEKAFVRQCDDLKKIEIRKSVNKWTSHFRGQREGNKEVEFQNEIRNSLNKLTPDNYEIIKQELLVKVANSQEKCEFLVKRIIEKGWSEPKYTKVYAQLCNFLQSAKELELEEESNGRKESMKHRKKKNMFKSSLLGNIQNCFEEDKKGKVLDDEKEKELEKNKKKKKLLGVVKFIGELFLIKVLPEVIIQLCATTMLIDSCNEFLINQPKNGCNQSSESNLEGILSLYDNVGKFLEKKENEEKSKKSLKNSTLIDQIKTTLLSKNQNGRLDEKNEAIFSFEEILNLLEFLMKNLELNKRTHILIKNLLEKRKENWKEGVFSGEIPKKISELHKEYKLEQETSAGINPYNRIVIIPSMSIAKHCSTVSSETKSTESGTPRSISNGIEIEHKIKKSLLKLKKKENTYNYDKFYESIKKLLSKTNNKKLILCKFLQNFYNDIASNVQNLLFVPYALYEERFIEKKDFIEAFNQSFHIIWEDAGDNPKLLEFLSSIFFDFSRNKVCLYDELEDNEELMKDNEEYVEVFNEFMRISSNLITNQKLNRKTTDLLKSSIRKMTKNQVL